MPSMCAGRCTNIHALTLAQLSHHQIQILLLFPAGDFASRAAGLKKEASSAYESAAKNRPAAPAPTPAESEEVSRLASENKRSRSTLHQQQL